MPENTLHRGTEYLFSIQYSAASSDKPRPRLGRDGMNSVCQCRIGYRAIRLYLQDQLAVTGRRAGLRRLPDNKGNDWWKCNFPSLAFSPGGLIGGPDL